MKVEFKENDPGKEKCDALIIIVTKEDLAHGKGTKPKSSDLRMLLGDRTDQVEEAFSAGGFEGDRGQQLVQFSLFKSRTVIFVGTGERSHLTAESLRRAAASGIRTAKSQKSSSASISFLNSTAEQVSDYEVVYSIVEGALLGAYRFDKYLTEEKKKIRLESLVVLSEDVKSSIGKKAARDAELLCDAVYFARDLSNAPASEMYPETLADSAVRMARKFGLKATVLDEKKIRALRMGGLLAVSSGSARPPRFVVLEYHGASKSDGLYAIVGKGITFDSGGISLKPAAGMGEMKMDMSGAAAVFGTMQAIASLKLPVNVVGIVPACENLPGGSAYKPGDVVTTMSGKTIEVDNTDAEGRVILSDGLFYAQKYKPKAIIDLATLTGACVVALGHHATGMLGTADDVMSGLKDAGEKTYERVWQLPIFEEYEKQIKSDIADVKNTGGRWAGTITAALFLKKFIGNFPWVHLDIAGTAMLEEPNDYSPKGGSGVGVRLLTQFFKQASS